MAWPERFLDAIAVGAGLYAIDQDPGHTNSQGQVTKYYLDSAPLGVTLGVLGVASVGVGVWSWTRNAHAASIPTVSLSSSRAMFGWTGEF